MDSRETSPERSVSHLSSSGSVVEQALELQSVILEKILECQAAVVSRMERLESLPINKFVVDSDTNVGTSLAGAAGHSAAVPVHWTISLETLPVGIRKPQENPFSRDGLRKGERLLDKPKIDYRHPVKSARFQFVPVSDLSLERYRHSSD